MKSHSVNGCAHRCCRKDSSKHHPPARLEAVLIGFEVGGYRDWLSVRRPGNLLAGLGSVQALSPARDGWAAPVPSPSA
jgi:hypothetical protein